MEAEAYALAFKNVYTFGPTFRAENSNTSRHAAEFWMIEPEIAFADLTDNRNLAEDMMKFMLSYVMENAAEEMKFFNSFIDKGLIERLENIVESDFECITYTEAIDILKKSKEDFQFPVEWGIDLQTEHERYISEKVFKGPVYHRLSKGYKSLHMGLNDDEKAGMQLWIYWFQVLER